MRMSNITPEMVERGKKRMPLFAFLAFLASMLAAYVMNYFGIAWGVYDWIGAIELGIWSWIGFVAPAMLGQVPLGAKTILAVPHQRGVLARVVRRDGHRAPLLNPYDALSRVCRTSRGLHRHCGAHLYTGG